MAIVSEVVAHASLVGGAEITLHSHAVVLKTSYGQYTGDSATQDRPIAHGLGVTPKVVLIHRTDMIYAFRITAQQAAIKWWKTPATAAAGSENVAAMDATNFYVGKAGKYNETANLTTIVYHWVAIG